MICDLMITADYDLQVSEVMNELSRRMSIEKRWIILLDTAKCLVVIESQCDKERSNDPGRAYTSFYHSWWKVRNLRGQIAQIKSRRMDIEMTGVVGGGY